MNGVRPLYVVLLALALAGCAGTGQRYQVNVGNGRPDLPPIQRVELDLDGKTRQSFARIAPQKIAATKPRSGEIPQTVTVRWTDPKGEHHEETLAVGREVEPDFRGQLLLNILSDNSVTLTPLPPTGEEISTLPWNTPEAWEGSISVPGFNQ